ncbi:Hypothetical predicted protein [Pelobates cultripes]|uniref:Transposase n=1 Tax=Pelobates cultripes TaxID=61616 RepID=A0AAD1R5V6_PELCU|nr:Hypothetical predicted protein [Pelobates cultripes]
MSQGKHKKNASKEAKLKFFTQKPSQTALHVQAATRDGGGSSDEGSSSPETGEPTLNTALTKRHLQEAMEALSARLIQSWTSNVDTLRKDILDLGARTTRTETKMAEYATAHNELAEQVSHLQHTIETMEIKLMDAEDRSRRNNLRLRGIPEAVLQDDLPRYVRDLFNVIAPDIPSDMLLLDRVHRIPKPKHLPPSTPRDVLLRAHYFHVKEIILKSSRTTHLPTEFAGIRIFADLSQATLKKRKTFQQVTTTLRDHNIRYRWGYPTKLLVWRNGEFSPLTTPADGMKTLKAWGLQLSQAGRQPPLPASTKVTQDWKKA